MKLRDREHDLDINFEDTYSPIVDVSTFDT